MYVTARMYVMCTHTCMYSLRYKVYMYPAGTGTGTNICVIGSGKFCLNT